MEKAILGERRATSEANGLRRRREATAALIVILGAQTTVEYAATYLIKEPMYDSIFTGAAWVQNVQELLNGYETRFYDALGIAKPAFLTYREPVFLASTHSLGTTPALFLAIP